MATAGHPIFGTTSTLRGAAALRNITRGFPLERGSITAAAVGYLIGQVICTWPPIDRTFYDARDFRRAMEWFGASSKAPGDAIAQISALQSVRSRERAAIVLRFTLDAALHNPEDFWEVANAQRDGTMSGPALHGLTSLSNAAAQILEALEA